MIMGKGFEDHHLRGPSDLGLPTWRLLRIGACQGSISVTIGVIMAVLVFGMGTRILSGDPQIPYGGELAGIGASCAWAVGALLFSRVAVPAAAINLFKNTVGTLMLLVTLAVTSGLTHRPLLSADLAAWGWLVLSSVAGLVLGDTFYFRSLQILGARRGLVLGTLAPPLVVVIAWLQLGEAPTAALILGMGVTLAGIAWVVLERGGTTEGAGHYPGTVTSGVIFGVLGAAGQALGVVWSRQAMVGLDTSEASFIRLLAAAVIGLLYALYRGHLAGWGRRVLARGTRSRLLPATLSGTYVGIWLSLIAYKHSTSAAVATTLTSLQPLFVLPLVWMFLGQKLSRRAVLGAAVAVLGVVVLFLGVGVSH